MENVGVCPILDYTAEIWGYKEYPKINTIQNRAILVFKGVHNFAPNLGIIGDFGWTAINVRHKVAMIRYWNKLLNMAETAQCKLCGPSYMNVNATNGQEICRHHLN